MSHAHDEEQSSNRLNKILTLIAGVSFLVAALLAWLGQPYADWLFILSVAAGGIPVVREALEGLRERRITINLLVTIAAAGALYLGELPEAATVVFFFALAEAFEAFGEARSRKAVAALINNSPKTARLKNGKTLLVEEVSIGDVVEVRPGDMIPLDGVVIGGESSVDEAAITGESVPKEKYKNEPVYAGTLNQSGFLEIKVTKLAGDSTLNKIVTLIEQAEKSRPKMQDFLDRFAGYYIPIAVGIAVLVAFVPPLLLGQDFSVWFEKALILLVLACPDALVVSAPVAVAAAIGGASKRGVLVKGGRYLEVLSKVKAVAFDKTKTLTVGIPKVAELKVFHGATKEDVLADAAGLEKFSSHPLAKAIEEYAEAHGVKPHDMDKFQNVAGRGGNANCMVCETKEHAIGNLQHIGASTRTCKEVLKEVERMEQQGMTSVLVSEGNTVIGVIGITDQLRPESAGVVAALDQAGVSSIMLTGDNKRAAHYVAKQVGITEVHGALLPEEKADLIDKMQTKYGRVAMVGDGVNDAPSLAKADVGIAMGGGGSDIAIETADVTLMNDAIENIPYVIRLGQQTFRVVRQNVFGSVFIKGIILVAGMAGMVSLGAAVAIDAITAILVVINGLRLFGTHKLQRTTLKQA